MGGVDLGDQRIATCSRLMKGNIWYYKIFFQMLEVAVLSAHIMYQGAGHQGVSLGDFKELVVEQLIGGNSFRRDTLSRNVPEHAPDVRFNREHFHYPVKTVETNKKSGNSIRVFVYVKCECVQHLALSAITLRSNISSMTRKGMGRKGSKMSMVDQGLDQEDPDKGDQDK